jgi:hypothetical protein
MGFVLGMTDQDINGTVIERRIEEVLAMGSKSTQVYKPRAAGLEGNKNMKHYSDDMIAYATEKAGNLLHIFGYVDFDQTLLVPEQQSTTNTPFFKINSTPDQLEAFNLYK